MQRIVRACVLAALAAALVPAAAPAAVMDDFNDANDTGWTRYQPLEPLGAGGTYSFPNGGYRIQAPMSPAPSLAGPARAGGFRESDLYTDFFVSVDFVDWDPTLDQAFGILSRVSEPGAGTTNGYAFTYAHDPLDPTAGSIDISIVNGEAADNLAPGVEVELDPTKDYRLVFTGSGTTLTGYIYDLADLSTPLASATAEDATYGNGFNGIFVYDNSPGGGATADATFDNYVADVVPEPTSAVLLLALLFPRRARRRV
jgi:hypothetical protein